jgi:hypothetical protein
MLHRNSRADDQWIGTPHISVFAADDILAAAIFLDAIIVREAAAQVKAAARRGELFPRLSPACSYAKRQVFVSVSGDLESGKQRFAESLCGT